MSDALPLRPRAGPTLPSATVCLALGVASSAFAGRPLTVDDAGTNAAGHGHVELWSERAAGATRVHTVSPAYAPQDGVELSASLSHNVTDRHSAAAVQLKWLLTPSREDGCNAGATLKAGHVGGEGDVAFVNGLLSCNGTPLGQLHFNVGTIRHPHDTPVAGWAETWGIALEHPLGGVTPHVEWFGERRTKPTFQVGARTWLQERLQIDGTLGRVDGTTVYSLGLKLQF